MELILDDFSAFLNGLKSSKIYFFFFFFFLYIYTQGRFLLYVHAVEFSFSGLKYSGLIARV
jgi:hypothetical protein